MLVGRWQEHQAVQTCLEHRVDPVALAVLVDPAVGNKGRIFPQAALKTRSIVSAWRWQTVIRLQPQSFSDPRRKD